MVETIRVSRISLPFTDKHSFKLKAQSHEFALDGILCQEGNSSLFLCLWYLVIKHCLNSYVLCYKGGILS